MVILAEINSSCPRRYTKAISDMCCCCLALRFVGLGESVVASMFLISFKCKFLFFFFSFLPGLAMFCLGCKYVTYFGIKWKYRFPIARTLLFLYQYNCNMIAVVAKFWIMTRNC